MSATEKAMMVLAGRAQVSPDEVRALSFWTASSAFGEAEPLVHEQGRLFLVALVRQCKNERIVDMCIKRLSAYLPPAPERGRVINIRA